MRTTESKKHEVLSRPRAVNDCLKSVIKYWALALEVCVISESNDRHRNQRGTKWSVDLYRCLGSIHPSLLIWTNSDPLYPILLILTHSGDIWPFLLILTPSDRMYRFLHTLINSSTTSIPTQLDIVQPNKPHPTRFDLFCPPNIPVSKHFGKSCPIYPVILILTKSCPIYPFLLILTDPHVIYPFILILSNYGSICPPYWYWPILARYTHSFSFYRFWLDIPVLLSFTNYGPIYPVQLILAHSFPICRFLVSLISFS